MEYAFGKDNVKWNDDSCEVTYPKGSCSPSYAKKRSKAVGGFGARSPLSSQSGTFRYDVYFEESFDWVKGGKLHGLGFGSGATGGDHPDTGGSIRLMWRRNGKADAYFYYPGMKEEYGESNIIGQFKKGEWNGVEIRVDGKKVTVRVNEDVKVFEKDFKAPLDHILYSTFFGGHDKSWAAKKDEVIKFRGIKFII